MTNTYKLIDGDPLEPTSMDLIAQTAHLPIGDCPADYREHSVSGWRVLTGNTHTNLWARVAYRYEIEANA